MTVAPGTLEALQQFDKTNNHVDYTAYWRRLGLAVVLAVRADTAIQCMGAVLEDSEAELSFRVKDQQFVVDGVLETGYYYDEGYLWKKMRK